MAYNPAMYNPYMQYGQYGQQTSQQQTYAPQPTQGIVWVDGETEAKGKQIPPGATQFAMWDINEPVIYIKSLNQFGIPNPLKKIHYQMDETPVEQKKLTSSEEGKDGTAYVRREELENMKEEILQALRESKAEQGTKRTVSKGE